MNEITGLWTNRKDNQVEVKKVNDDFYMFTTYYTVKGSGLTRSRFYNTENARKQIKRRGLWK